MVVRVISFELNEVPWVILDDFVAERPDSAIARLLKGSSCYTSVAADRGHLSPWTTWPTLHRGVNDARHMIASFGQDLRRANRRYPPIWTLLHDHGVSVGLCGSLHSYPPPDDLTSYAFYLPDSFATEPVAHPPALIDFQRFNVTMSRDSARNVDKGIDARDALRLVRHWRTLGIRPATCAALGAQLVAELRTPEIINRRRTYQAVLTFDIFERQLRRTNPAFSTFFTNHVASAMHRYWAAHRPEDYDELELDADWRRRFRGEVMWATEQADDMIGRLMSYCDATPDCELWVASSMGQRATRAEALETQLYLTDPARFMQAMGVESAGWKRRPAMRPQFNVVVEGSQVGGFVDALRSVRVAGRPLQFQRRAGGFFSVTFGQPNLHDRADAATVSGQPRSLGSLGLEAVEIADRSGTTAYHVPEGILAVYAPSRAVRPRCDRSPVSVLEIAPGLLERFGIPAPDYMEEPTTLTPA